jgi:hypothetical protein
MHRRAVNTGSAPEHPLLYFAAVRPVWAMVRHSKIFFDLGGAKGLEPLTPCLQNTRRLSDTVAHLGMRPRRVGQDRLASVPVVVRIGGQPWPCRLDAETLTLKRQANGPARVAGSIMLGPRLVHKDRASRRLLSAVPSGHGDGETESMPARTGRSMCYVAQTPCRLDAIL